MARAAWMEKIMSKINDTSKLDHPKLENRVLADNELDTVTGGSIIGDIVGSVAKAVLPAV
jgi:hypothetical protein